MEKVIKKTMNKNFDLQSVQNPSLQSLWRQIEIKAFNQEGEEEGNGNVLDNDEEFCDFTGELELKVKVNYESESESLQCFILPQSRIWKQWKSDLDHSLSLSMTRRLMLQAPSQVTPSPPSRPRNPKHSTLTWQWKSRIDG
jgi:hypothetical protein